MSRGALVDLLDLLERIGSARVLCIGDVMLDRFVYGAVERISPEAPIPVLRVGREAAMPGGAGNVVRNLVALGAHAGFVAPIGADAAGAELRAMLAQMRGVDATLIDDGARQTTVKTRYIAGGQQLLRADSESDAMLGAAARERILTAARSALASCQVVALSDYGKGALGEGVAAELIAAARAAGRLTVVDPKGADYRRYAGASVVTPNLRELALASGMPTAGDEQVVAASRKLIAECGIEAVLATRSGEGMSLIERDGRVSHVRAEARAVFDVAGAGDTVVAAIAAALAAGAPLEQAAALANHAAAIVVGKIGTAVATVPELRAAMEGPAGAAHAAKLMTLDQAIEHAARWRHNGFRVGFTNGCFDLLHPGHVSLLRQARAACDRLIVGLNSDESVRRLKGASRPVQSEAARAAVLSSLADVDAVVGFADDTPIGLIEALRPDVLVKGADYSEETVVGAVLVRSYGGRILLAELSPGHSTTATIGRLASKA